MPLFTFGAPAGTGSSRGSSRETNNDEDEDHIDYDENESIVDEDEDVAEGGQKMRESRPMMVYVETLTGTAFEVQVSPLEVVISIKEKIQRLEGIPVSQQHLLYNNAEMKDDFTLRDYNIYCGATLRLVLGLRGGPVNTRRIVAPVEHDHEEERAALDSEQERDRERKQLTIVVLRSVNRGQQVNLYRVLDHRDHSRASSSSSSTTALAALIPSRSRPYVEEEEKESALGLTTQDEIEDDEYMYEEKEDASRMALKLAHLKMRMNQTKQGKLQQQSQSESSEKDKLAPKDETKSETRVRARGGLGEESSGMMPSTSYAVSQVIDAAAEKDTNGRAHEDSDIERRSILKSIYARDLSSCSDRDKDALGTNSSWLRRVPNDKFDAFKIAQDILEAQQMRQFSSKDSLALDRMGKREKSSRKEASIKESNVHQTVPKMSEAHSSNHQHQHQQTRGARMKDFGNSSSRQKSRLLDAVPSSSNEAATPSGFYVEDLTDLAEIKFYSCLLDKAASKANLKPLSTASPSNNQSPSSPSKLRRSSMVRRRLFPLPPSTHVTTRTDGGSSPLDSNKTKTGVPVLPPVHTSRHNAPHLASMSKEKEKKPRCEVCGKKTRIGATYSCRCEGVFCAVHRYAEAHNCSFDYKAQGKKMLTVANPLVTATKLPKI